MKQAGEAGWADSPSQTHLPVTCRSQVCSRKERVGRREPARASQASEGLQRRWEGELSTMVQGDLQRAGQGVLSNLQHPKDKSK